MANLAKKFDSDLQDGERVAIPEETTEVNVSEGLINVNTVLNDGQLTDEEKSNLESSACNDNSCENPNGDDDGGNTPSANPVIIEDTKDDEEYDLTQGQGRNLARLTDELVEKEYRYALDNNDVPSRAHALTFLSRPPEMSDEEKDEADAEKAGKQTKAKFKFETAFSDVPFNRRMRRKLKKNLN